MSALLIWSVLCVGFALVCGAAESKFTMRQFVTGLGVGCIVWAAGLGFWYLVGVVIEVVWL